MRTAPPLLTERLLLRSLTLEDAADVQRLAGERDVASTLIRIPHPYEDGMAEEWIGFCADAYKKRRSNKFRNYVENRQELNRGYRTRTRERKRES